LESLRKASGCGKTKRVTAEPQKPSEPENLENQTDYRTRKPGAGDPEKLSDLVDKF